MPTSDEIRDINARVYHAHGITHHYHDDTLAREDASGLLKCQSAFANKGVLDIGMSAGRTSIYLAPLSHRYQAIDYSPAILQKCNVLHTTAGCCTRPSVLLYLDLLPGRDGGFG